LRSFLFCLQTAIQNLWFEKWINILTILTIATGLLISGVFVLITFNLDSTIKHWSKDFGLVIYLRDDITADEERSLTEYIQNDADVLEVKYISKDAALSEFKQTLGAMSSVLEGLVENPLPSAFELRLKKEALEPMRIKQKTSRIKGMRGVEDVQYGVKWLSSLYSITKAIKILTTIFGAIISIAVIFATYTAIKILCYRRLEEIETLKLLGATKGFIRLPFLLEGIILGTFGGIVGFLSLLSVYYLAVSKLTESIPVLKSMMVFFPVNAYPVIPLIGAVMGLTGSFFAVGRIKY